MGVYGACSAYGMFEHVIVFCSQAINVANRGGTNRHRVLGPAHLARDSQLHPSDGVICEARWHCLFSRNKKNAAHVCCTIEGSSITLTPAVNKQFGPFLANPLGSEHMAACQEERTMNFRVNISEDCPDSLRV